MIGFVTLLAVGAVSWLVSPALAQGRSAPIALKAATAAAGPVAPASPGAVGLPLSTSASLRPATITPFEMSYGTGRRQQYLAYLPTQRTSSMAVVLIHGGGWVAGSAEDTARYNEKLYDAGITSFSIDYRYATDAAWPAQRDDLENAMAAIRTKAAKWGVEAGSIAVMGVSAGGHMALDLASGPGRVATCAVVSYSGPTSMKLVLDDAVVGPKQLGLAKSMRKLAPTKKARKSATVPHSPSASDAPAMLFASQYDWVDNRNTTRYADAYAGIDLDVESVVLPGEHRHASGYALNDPQVWMNSLDFLRRHCA